jgi:hypothetical protein
MPPLLQGDWYLLNDFMATGRLRNDAMGIMPLSWLDIAAWMQVSGAEITGEEAELMRTLSMAYVSELRKASGKTPTPPYVGGRHD